MRPAAWAYLALLGVLVAALHGARGRFWLFALLSLPGTLAHEGCHFLVGLALGGRPAGFSVWPRREEGRWILGSVPFRNLRWHNVCFIALAPLLLLPAAWIFVRWRLAAGPLPDGQEALGLFLVANLVHGCVPSGTDLGRAARSPVGWLILSGGLVLGWRLGPERMARAVRAILSSPRTLSAPPAPAPCPRGSCA